MAEYPAMPLWTDRYLADCSHLGWLEHGMYVVMLMELWRAPNRRFPNDDQWLARKFRCPIEEVENGLRPLIKEFFKTSKKTIWHKVVDREWEYVDRLSKNQSDRAKSMWAKRKDICRGNATSGSAASGIDPAMPPTPTPSSVPYGTVGPADAGPNVEPDVEVKKLLYDKGRAMLGQSAGGEIAKALAALNEGGLAEVLAAMEKASPLEPMGWFKKAVAARKPKATRDGYASITSW